MPYSNVIQIVNKLHTIGKQTYIVGGYCRDSILELQLDGDIDLATNALPEEIEDSLKTIAHIGKKYGTSIINEGNEYYEITTFRKDIGSINNRKPAEVEFTDKLEEDAKRRDFTMNAIYYNPIKSEYIDPTGGIKDLENGIIRFIGNKEDRIDEDALRILRYIRFKNKYNLEAAKNTYTDTLKRKIHLLQNISIERIKDELDKILLLENNIQALKDLKEIGFFTLFLTEIEALENTPGSKYHQEGNVWIHTLMTLKYLNGLRKKSKKDASYFLDLYWAMLFHDIAKTECLSTDSDGNVHYYGHENSGSEIFRSKIAQELRFSTSSKNRISWIIENHLKVFKVMEMKKLKSRKLMMHKYFTDLMIIGESDHMGRIPATIDVVDRLKEFYSDFQEILSKKTFFTGKDIMKKYPHLQGIAIGNKLREENDKILISD
ncbi:CCA tRNA nucleotidyltransferase [Candidatus Gracilibacteria bacterium 28_42_T64]|nr:CCA tRNA nucleotidyltransferase [Candidatus Gracilibacteria bacterium 28_42_T64]